MAWYVFPPLGLHFCNYLDTYTQKQTYCGETVVGLNHEESQEQLPDYRHAVLCVFSIPKPGIHTLQILSISSTKVDTTLDTTVGAGMATDLLFRRFTWKNHFS